ncbi:hypothetical protein BH18ACT15_BH18ACT15_13360 [soil metagenome]
MGQAILSRLTTRTWIAALLTGLLLAALPGRLPAAAGAGAQRPNVLVVVTDDQPLRAMSAMPKTRSWFQERGTRFANAFVTTPQCCPSRASILTGRYAHNTGVLDNTLTDALNHRSTVQRYLQKAGYRTAIFGKFLNFWDISRNPPYFDRWAVAASSERYRDGMWNVNGRVEQITRYSTSFIRSRALAFLAASHRYRRPWFLLLTPNAPHAPFSSQRRYADAPVSGWHGDPAVFEDDPAVDPGGRIDKPPYVHDSSVGFGRGERIREAQLRTLMSVDDMMGDLREELRDTQQRGETLVLFTSDNGYLWGEHGRSGKAVPYSPSIRVPFYMSWPDRGVDRGSVDRRLAANVDIAPTILRAARLSPSRRWPIDGHSLLGSRSRSRILTEFWDRKKGDVPNWASTTTLHRQYTEYYSSGTISGTEEYDLRSDPWQLRNLLYDPRYPGGTTEPLLSAQLAEDRACKGTEEDPSADGSPPCP